MNKLQQRVQQRGQGGFTLIELLVVIAILAILAGVVVFAVGNSTENAKLSSCKTEMASIKTAVAAATTANLVNTTAEKYTAYLESSLTYFAAPGTAASPDTTLTFTGTAKAPAGCTAAGSPAGTGQSFQVKGTFSLI